MENEERKPLEIVCPYCGKTTTVIFHEDISGWREGILYDLEYGDFETTEVNYDGIDWEFLCHNCRAELDEEEIEELMNDIDSELSPEDPKIEGGVDLFGEFWKRNLA